MTGSESQGAGGVGSAGTVVVVGSINVDQVVTVDRLPLPGETLIGSSMTLSPGGKGANQAVAAAHRGARTVMIGAVGDDGRADDALPHLRSSGVDVSGVATVPGPTGLAIVSVGGDSENTIVVVPGANGAVGASAVGSHSAVLAEAAVVVLQGEIPVDGIAAAVQHAGGRVVFNLAPVIDVPSDVVKAADPLVVNEHEGRLLLAAWGGSASGAAGAVSASASASASVSSSASDEEARVDDESVVASLRAQGVTSVVMTRGAAGAIVSDASGTVLVASPRVAAVDSSGAGDAFVGALAAGLAAGASLVEAARDAVRVGAFSVTGVGTQASYPTLDDELPAAAAAGVTS
ncbi:ribokinase [Frigoribacterium sp. VKM Ac-2836]|uniref:ribokinase n=1 Tax=Frigoribacterium sp. VKM Ac-2836 TaxID=2739014 RepID=UPI00156791AA|nr:ribokinase [Frigoribacterium sp. VKM Ac-2836]NRD26353.1 ribokinase [Frigoribacterium sp. VKM Ac-2836]